MPDQKEYVEERGKRKNAGSGLTTWGLEVDDTWRKTRGAADCNMRTQMKS